LTLLAGQRPFPATHRGTAGPCNDKIISRPCLRFARLAARSARPGPRCADRPGSGPQARRRD